MHNGLFGPATDLLCALIGHCQDGTVTGSSSASHAEVTVAGAMVRSLLKGMGPLDDLAWYFRRDPNHALAEFLDSIVDEDEYEISAGEA